MCWCVRASDAIPPYHFVSLLRQLFPQFAQQNRGAFMQQDAEELYGAVFSALASVSTSPHAPNTSWTVGVHTELSFVYMLPQAQAGVAPSHRVECIGAAPVACGLWLVIATVIVLSRWEAVMGAVVESWTGWLCVAEPAGAGRRAEHAGERGQPGRRAVRAGARGDVHLR
jgi:hypothetical protein